MNDDERIELLLKALGENAYNFAKKIGVSAASIYQVTGGRNAVSKKLASLIVGRYDRVNETWLLTGTGEMFKAKDNASGLQTDEVQAVKMASGDYGLGSIVLDDTCETYTIPGISEGFLLQVRDDAMLPLYKPGDIVAARFVGTDPPVIAWGNYYVVILRDLGFLRKLMPHASADSILLKPGNPSFPEFTVKKAEILQLAKIMGYWHGQ